MMGTRPAACGQKYVQVNRIMDSLSKKNPLVEEEPSSRQPKPYKADIVAELIGLDRYIMKLLVWRFLLVICLRVGKELAASSAEANAEKAVRTAWERNAVSFSRDEKFVRQLFSLLQEIRVDSMADAAARSAFNLAPARRPVVVNLPGPKSVTATRMLAVLAAWLGESLVLENVLFNDPLMDCVKALNSAGASFSWITGSRTGEGTLKHQSGGSGISLVRDKALYLGDDPLTVYLMAFLAVAQVGKVRFTGGSALKMADLSPLRRFLPELGARLAHSMPKSNGLPGSVESSGVEPDSVTIPADLPREGVMALFCAVAAWKKRVRLDCAALPLPFFSAVLSESLPVLRACSVADSLEGTILTLDATRISVPGGDACPLDPTLCAYLLALPAFAGGTVFLRGRWDETMPLVASGLGLLLYGGLHVDAGDAGIGSTVDISIPADSAALDLRGTDASLLPLGLALAVRQVWRRKAKIPQPLLPEGLDRTVLEGFFRHTDVECRNGMLVPLPVNASGEEKSSWTSPSAEWAFAYALCAYDRPNLHLTNPAITGTLMPSFWSLYNALPDPSEEKKLRRKRKRNAAAYAPYKGCLSTIPRRTI